MCCRETMGSTEDYKMVLTIIPCLFVFLWPISNIEKIFMHILVFSLNWWLPLKPPQEARKVFIQHPRYNIEVFPKRTKDGRSIIHRHWPKVAKTFNINEGSIFAFRFSSFLDEIHFQLELHSIYIIFILRKQNFIIEMHQSTTWYSFSTQVPHYTTAPAPRFTCNI